MSTGIQSVSEEHLFRDILIFLAVRTELGKIELALSRLCFG